MKIFSHNIINIVLGMTLFISCTNYNKIEEDKGDDVLTLTTSSYDLFLAEQNYNDNALTLSWTSGSNYGTGHRIVYRLEIAKEGTNFSNPYVALEDEERKFSWSTTVEELNTIMRTEFNAHGTEKIALEARLIATVNGTDKFQISTVSFNVTTYKPLTSTLYLIGDATPNSWSVTDAIPMIQSEKGIFIWSGQLKAGLFKLITDNNKSFSSYVKGSDGQLLFQTSEEESDQLFSVGDTHYYTLTVNLFTEQLTLTKIAAMVPRFTNLYFVGNSTGWSFVQMRQDPLDPYLFRYGHLFLSGEGGEFKFGTANGSWENMYKSTNTNASYKETNIQFVKNSNPDNKWFLKTEECGKAYKICVDIRTGKERMLMNIFVPYEMIYMVVSANSSDSTIDEVIPMIATDNPYVFTWKGYLNTGLLKFTCDKQSNVNGAWFMPMVDEKIPSGIAESILYIDKSSDSFLKQYLYTDVIKINYNWRITNSGIYKITLNQLAETILIEKE